MCTKCTALPQTTNKLLERILTNFKRTHHKITEISGSIDEIPSVPSVARKRHTDNFENYFYLLKDTYVKRASKSWVSNPQPGRLYYVPCDHICKLCMNSHSPTWTTPLYIIMIIMMIIIITIIIIY